jgi:hypothetical protein
METRTVHITLEVQVAGDDLRGHATNGDPDARREFSGRLGLLCAIEDLLASHGTDTPQEKR